MHYQRWIFGPLVVALISAILVRADYIMDDSNSTITYAGYWGRNYLTDIDPSRLFNRTTTYSACKSDNGCYAAIPFVGSGINIHNMISYSLNISFTLDGGPSSTFIYSNQGCLPIPHYCYNVSVFNAQSLTYGTHTLNITMLTSGDIYASYFFFDYAVISTLPSSSTSSSVIPSSSSPVIPSSPSSPVIPSSTGNPMPSSQRSPDQLSAIIGGAIGGVGAVIAIVLAVLCYQKRGHLSRRPRVEIDPPPFESSFQSATFISNPPGQVNTASHDDWSPSSLLPRGTNLQTNDISPPPILPKPSIPSATADVPIPLVYSPPSQLLSQPAETLTVPNSGSLPTGASAASPTTSTHLTEEQLVQELIRHNVPLVTVAGVMDSLLGREGASGGQGSGSRVLPNNGALESGNPPDYDFG